MRKLLGILVMGLLLSGNSFADVEEVLKEIKKNKDIVQGYKRVKDEGDDNRSNNWRVPFHEIYDTDKSLRKHVVKIVNKSDNHPVRFGKQSLRFEVREILMEGIEKGLLLLYSGRNILRLLPPLVIKEEDVTKSLQILDELFTNEEKRKNAQG